MNTITLGSLLNPVKAPTPIDPPHAPKLCKDCKYIATNGSGTWQHYRCGAPKNPFKINLVTGDKIHTTPFCQEVRDTESLCGHIGNWYEYYERPVFQAPVSTPAPSSTITRRKSTPAITAEDL